MVRISGASLGPIRTSGSTSPSFGRASPPHYSSPYGSPGRSPKGRKEPENQMGLNQCEHCGSTNTPLWRSGPSGPKSLCNACGLRWTKGTLRVNGKNGPSSPARKITRPTLSATLVPAVPSDTEDEPTPMQQSPTRAPKAPRLIKAIPRAARIEKHPIAPTVQDHELAALGLLAQRPDQAPTTTTILRPTVLPARDHLQADARSMCGALDWDTGHFHEEARIHEDADSPVEYCVVADLQLPDLMEVGNIHEMLNNFGGSDGLVAVC